jgi:hypothetical protein
MGWPDRGWFWSIDVGMVLVAPTGAVDQGTGNPARPGPPRCCGPAGAPSRRAHMTTIRLRPLLIALRTAFGTWKTYRFGALYRAACDALYDCWVGCADCGRPPCDGRLVTKRVGLLGGAVGRERPACQGTCPLKQASSPSVVPADPFTAGFGHRRCRARPIGRRRTRSQAARTKGGLADDDRDSARTPRGPRSRPSSRASACLAPVQA